MPQLFATRTFAKCSAMRVAGVFTWRGVIEIFGDLFKIMEEELLRRHDGREFSGEDQTQCAHEAGVVAEGGGEDGSQRETTANRIRGEGAAQFT